jgi:hypothetical protein
MLLTALALSDDTLLAALRGSHVLQRVELSLHSCKVLAAQDVTWLSAWRAIYDLQRVLRSLAPVQISLVEPYSNERVLCIWHNIGSRASALRDQLL